MDTSVMLVGWSVMPVGESVKGGKGALRVCRLETRFPGFHRGCGSC